MRVLAVDDSAFMRRALSQMLATAEDVQVVGAARNGREGLEMARQLKPDVITLDIEMPEMDGLTALQHIMQECPTQVLMLSSLTTEGSHAALRALSLGAADVLAKDASQISLSITKMQAELVSRVRALGSARPIVFDRSRPLRAPVLRMRCLFFARASSMSSASGQAPVVRLCSKPFSVLCPKGCRHPSSWRSTCLRCSPNQCRRGLMTCAPCVCFISKMACHWIAAPSTSLRAASTRISIVYAWHAGVFEWMTNQLMRSIGLVSMRFSSPQPMRWAVACWASCSRAWETMD